MSVFLMKVPGKGHIARCSIHIDALPSRVWNGLTNPVMIKQYFFGTDVISDWREGSTIRFRGNYEGVDYEDRGVILKMIPEKEYYCTVRLRQKVSS